MTRPTTHWSATGDLHTGAVDGCGRCEEAPTARTGPYGGADEGPGGVGGRFRGRSAEMDRSNDYRPVTTDDAQEGEK